MARHNDLGHQGEEVAASYLQKKGYKIVASNWRFGKEEIDIIARNDDELVIVEVKTRTGRNYQMPWEAVNKRKQRFLINAAEAYIMRYNIDMETRFDVISIVAENGKFEVEHIEHAFYPFI